MPYVVDSVSQAADLCIITAVQQLTSTGVRVFKEAHDEVV